MSKAPIAVLISDVHFNVHTLPLAQEAVRIAIVNANNLGVSLIVAGDLHDTKANMRGECVTAMYQLFGIATYRPYILIGNHDLINEQSYSHSLEFLDSKCHIIDYSAEFTNFSFIPYQNNSDMFLKRLSLANREKPVIVHQGILGSNSGDYIQDRTAVPKEMLAYHRVISGHYHTRQDIHCGPIGPGKVGLASYIGNPYTLNFAESKDPAKGYQILYDDGSLEFVPLNLRKHIVIEYTAPAMSTDLEHYFNTIRDEDLVWAKVSGTKEDLLKITRPYMAQILKRQNFKLDLIPTDTETATDIRGFDLAPTAVLDILIDSTSSSDRQKTSIKGLYRQLIAKD